MANGFGVAVPCGGSCRRWVLQPIANVAVFVGRGVAVCGAAGIKVAVSVLLATTANGGTVTGAAVASTAPPYSLPEQ